MGRRGYISQFQNSKDGFRGTCLKSDTDKRSLFKFLKHDRTSESRCAASVSFPVFPPNSLGSSKAVIFLTHGVWFGQLKPCNFLLGSSFLCKKRSRAQTTRWTIGRMIIDSESSTTVKYRCQVVGADGRGGSGLKKKTVGEKSFWKRRKLHLSNLTSNCGP